MLALSEAALTLGAQEPGQNKFQKTQFSIAEK